MHLIKLPLHFVEIILLGFINLKKREIYKYKMANQLSAITTVSAH